MKRIALVVPGSIETRSGGYEYNRRIAAGLRARGWTVNVHETAGSLAAIADGTTVVIDGLALGAVADQAERESQRLRLVALVHMPLADDSGLDRATAERLEASERRALTACALIVVTGAATATTIEGYGVPRDRLAVVEPGTDRAPIARGSGDESPHLICVAALTRGKGHEILIAALATLRDRQWTLACAGSLDRDPETVERVRAQIRLNGLEGRVSLVGELDWPALSALYDRADLFVLATLHETYGMAVAEALARGLPVISTTTGAMPDLVSVDAGLLVPPGDVNAIGAALACAIDDRSVRDRLAIGARRVRDRLPTWEIAVDQMAAVLGPISNDGRITTF